MATNVTNVVNWNAVVSEAGLDAVELFASGQLSGRQLTDLVAYSPAAGEVRKLLRSRGVQQARTLARKALARR